MKVKQEFSIEIAFIIIVIELWVYVVSTVSKKKLVKVPKIQRKVKEVDFIVIRRWIYHIRAHAKQPWIKFK